VLLQSFFASSSRYRSRLQAKIVGFACKYPSPTHSPLHFTRFIINKGYSELWTFAFVGVCHGREFQAKRSL
jgi:hypothetical protein